MATCNPLAEGNQSMSRRQPKLTLPPAVDDALEQLMLEDRAWFDAHPRRRQYRRPVHWSERRSHELVCLMTGQGPGLDALEVLVVRAPSTSGMRARVFLPVEAAQQGPFKRHAAVLASTATTEEFMRQASAGTQFGEVGCP
jgi:hypothetical protein